MNRLLVLVVLVLVPIAIFTTPDTTTTPKFDSCYLKISRKARKNLVFYLFYN